MEYWIHCIAFDAEYSTNIPNISHLFLYTVSGASIGATASSMGAGALGAISVTISTKIKKKYIEIIPTLFNIYRYKYIYMHVHICH